MAQPNDTSFGSGFDADAFRSAIKSAMQMGSPNTSSEKAVFKWKEDRTYSEAVDENGDPYDWTATPSSTVSPPDVTIDVAIEFATRSTLSGTTIFGDFDTPRAVLTVLDDDYDQLNVSTYGKPDFVEIGGNTYEIEYVLDLALFTVDVKQIYASARDET